MCGRYTIVSPERIVAALHPDSSAADLSRPRYNVAPQQRAPVMAQQRGQRALADAQWGLVPGWAKDPAIGQRLINARAETLGEKPAFRAAFRRHRCLVPADGFYEWKRTPPGKTPMYVRLRDGAPFAFAGLYAWWGEDSAPLLSFTIVTTRPNRLMAAIHDRMPAILPPAAWDAWLDESITDPTKLGGCLEPFDADAMQAVAVSPYVNSPAHDDARCIAPAAAGASDAGRETQATLL